MKNFRLKLIVKYNLKFHYFYTNFIATTENINQKLFNFQLNFLAKKDDGHDQHHLLGKVK